MLFRHLPQSRSILPIRPLRPPNPPHQPRPFTQNTQHLLLTPRPPRPQLPYLSQPAFKRSPQLHLAQRLLSTETKAYMRDLGFQAGKWTLAIWLFVFLGGIVSQGWKMESEERKHPTPSEWKFLTRQNLRWARGEKDVLEEKTAPLIDWPKVGSHLKECLFRLEQPEGDGQGLIPLGGEGDEDLLIPDVGKAGYDVSEKSYQWKTGYFETLMLAAEAAEHLENMVLDRRRKKVFPREVVIGPSNPDPRPTPVYMDSAPNEEDCEKFYDPPETYYMKILTTKGFTTRQRLDAVEGYANWLEFKGLNESAEEMYKWGIDIAKSALPNPAAANSVVDARTNVLKAEGEADDLTHNLLRATTNLATHHARNGDIASALPILLSVLRARRSAPLPSTPLTADDQQDDPETPKTDIGAAIAMVRRWVRPAKFPPPPPSGDTPLVRHSEKPTCEEGELMVYIGEILFASHPGSEGVGWTRQGCLIAEANIQSKRGQASNSQEDDGRKCKECLLTGVKNWELMLRQLTESRAETSGREGSRDAGWLEWRGWFGGDGGAKGKTLDEVGKGVLEEELKQVQRLRARIVKENIEVELSKGQGPGGPWFG